MQLSLMAACGSLRKLLGMGTIAICLPLCSLAGKAAQQAPTAGDQSNRSSDIKLAAQIRRAIVRDKSLSTRAHNITIVVKDGTVTLRGTVESEQEKRTIRRKAQQVAQSATINDLLTVK